MPINLIAQAIIPYTSGLPTDVITNTWSFRDFSANNDLATAADVLNPFLQDFYDHHYSGRPAYIGPANLWKVRWYNRDAPPPRVPYELDLRTTASGIIATKVPSEVSAVLSFQGVKLSGAPQARRRGRIYLGALVDTWLENASATAPPMIAAAVAGDIAATADTLRNAVEGAGDYMWTVWSQTNNSYVQVTDGWVDNSPDTQRRRGVDPTSRFLWS